MECEQGGDLAKAIEEQGVLNEYQQICDQNRMVLNSKLIVIPSTNQVDTQNCDYENTHIVIQRNSGNSKIDRKIDQFDIERYMYSFLEKILKKIEKEADDFADAKNEGLIITLADISIDESFTTLKNRRTCRKMKSVGDLLGKEIIKHHLYFYLKYQI